MHAISSYRGHRPTNNETNKATNPQTRVITIHCAAASAQCNNNKRKNTKKKNKKNRRFVHKISLLLFTKTKTSHCSGVHYNNPSPPPNDHTFGSPAGDRCFVRGDANWIFCSGRSRWYLRASMRKSLQALLYFTSGSCSTLWTRKS